MRSIKGFILRLKYFVRGLRQVGKPHLGAKVIFAGSQYVLTQGVQHPYWNLTSTTTGARREDVHIAKCKMDRSLAGIWRAMKFHYDFYMRYWYDIDLRHFRLLGR